MPHQCCPWRRPLLAAPPWVPAFAGTTVGVGWSRSPAITLAGGPSHGSRLSPGWRREGVGLFGSVLGWRPLPAASLGSRFRGNDGRGGWSRSPAITLAGGPSHGSRIPPGWRREGVGLIGSVLGWRPLPAAPLGSRFRGNDGWGGHPYRQDGGERGTPPSPYRSTGQALAFPPRGKGLLLGLGLLLLFAEADGFPVGGVFSHVDASFPLPLEGV